MNSLNTYYSRVDYSTNAAYKHVGSQVKEWLNKLNQGENTMTLSQVKLSHLANKTYEIEPLKAFAEKNALIKAEADEPIDIKDYAKEIAEVHKLDERV